MSEWWSTAGGVQSALRGEIENRDTRIAELSNCVAVLEAKLSLAVGELEEMLMIQNSEAAYGILRVYTKALLRELKEEK